MNRREGLNGRRSDTVRYTQIGGGRAVLTEQIILVVTLTLTGCLLLAMETTLFARISLSSLGMGRAAPSLGLLFCMSAGFLYGERVGGGFGLFVGFLADSMDYSREGTGIMLLPLICFLFGSVSGIVGKRRLAHNLPSFTVFVIFGGGVECLIGILGACVQYRSFPPISWIWQGLMPIWVLTVFFSPIVYGILYFEKWLMGHRK